MVEVSVVARGGLIAGVLQVEGEGSTGFRQAWRVGRKWFWTLFGIALLAGLPTVVLGLVSGGVSVVLLVLAALTGGPEASEATP
jgi:uncharacterized membrane protein